MAVTQYYWSGEAQWAKVFAENRDLEYGDKCTLNVILDDQSAAQFAESGSRLKIREDGSVKFSRNFESPNENHPEWGGAPVVVDANGEVMTIDTPIGNGSHVTILVTVYDSQYGKGTRLEKVQVTDLVEYEGDAVTVIAADDVTPF